MMGFPWGIVETPASTLLLAKKGGCASSGQRGRAISPHPVPNLTTLLLFGAGPGRRTSARFAKTPLGSASPASRSSGRFRRRLLSTFVLPAWEFPGRQTLSPAVWKSAPPRVRILGLDSPKSSRVWPAINPKLQDPASPRGRGADRGCSRVTWRGDPSGIYSPSCELRNKRKML